MTKEELLMITTRNSRSKGRWEHALVCAITNAEEHAPNHLPVSPHEPECFGEPCQGCDAFPCDEIMPILDAQHKAKQELIPLVFEE